MSVPTDQVKSLTERFQTLQIQSDDSSSQAAPNSNGSGFDILVAATRFSLDTAQQWWTYITSIAANPNIPQLTIQEESAAISEPESKLKLK